MITEPGSMVRWLGGGVLLMGWPRSVTIIRRIIIRLTTRSFLQILMGIARPILPEWRLHLVITLIENRMLTNILKTNDLTNIINWLQTWYFQQCDGDWEHEYGIKIYTIDNPGWAVKIDLNGTRWEFLDMDRKRHEKSETDWYDYQIKNGVYAAYGDPHKLRDLIVAFKNVVT